MTSPNYGGQVSGPAQYSERTDDKQPIRTPTGLPYGEAGQLTEVQQQAPLPASPAPPKLGEPSTRPDQPVTAGAALGPGAGPEALEPQAVGMPSGGAVAQTLARVASADNSGVFARLYAIALQKGL